MPNDIPYYLANPDGPQISGPTVPVNNENSPESVTSSQGILGQINKPLGSVPSQTIAGHTANVRLPRNNQMGMMDTNQQPISGDLHDKKIARINNAWGSLSNAISTASNAIKQKHFDTVQHDVKTVLDAQTQIDQANQIISSEKTKPGTYTPQDMQNAQSVLTKNQDIQNRYLSDPKKTKTFEKALDISFIDPEKNNTPEIKAAMAARKAHAASAASGLTADDPAEKRLQELLNNREKTASYSDQMQKQLPATMNSNPEYETYAKNYENQQKLIEKVLPTMLTQKGETDRQSAELESKKWIADLTARTQEYKAQTAANAAIQRQKMVDNTHITTQSMHDATIKSIANERVLSSKAARADPLFLMADKRLKTAMTAKSGLMSDIDRYEKIKQNLEIFKKASPEVVDDINSRLNNYKAQMDVQDKIITASQSQQSVIMENYGAGNNSTNPAAAETTTVAPTVVPSSNGGSDTDGITAEDAAAKAADI